MKDFKIGQRFTRTVYRTTEKREYILAMVGRKGASPLYALIDLVEGNRWIEPVLDIEEVFGIYEHEFTLVDKN